MWSRTRLAFSPAVRYRPRSPGTLFVFLVSRWKRRLAIFESAGRKRVVGRQRSVVPVRNMVRLSFELPNGRPATHIPVLVSRDSTDRALVARTDREGRLELEVPGQLRTATRRHDSGYENLVFTIIDGWPGGQRETNGRVTRRVYRGDVGTTINLGNSVLPADPTTQDELIVLRSERETFTRAVEGCPDPDMMACIVMEDPKYHTGARSWLRMSAPVPTSAAGSGTEPVT